MGNHYREGFGKKIHTLDFIKDKLTQEQYIGFLLGNILKYAARCNFKNQTENDLYKCSDYGKLLDEYICELEGLSQASGSGSAVSINDPNEKVPTGFRGG